MKINFADKQVRYVEIRQGSSTKFSFLKGNDELFWPVKCRDFLGDAVFSNATGQKVYTFEFEFANKLDEDATKLVVHYGDLDELNRFLSRVGELNQIEKQNNLNLTVVHQVEIDCLALIADPFWQTSMWGISLYTHLVRCLGNKLSLEELFTTKNLDLYSEKPQNEAGYMQRIGKNRWNKLITNLRVIREITPDVSGWMESTWVGHENKLHNSSGFVTLFSNKIVGNKFSEAFHAM